jgi:hypothetical protein
MANDVAVILSSARVCHLRSDTWIPGAQHSESMTSGADIGGYEFDMDRSSDSGYLGESQSALCAVLMRNVGVV